MVNAYSDDCWLSKCHWIFANVGVDDFHDGTWACRMKGEVSVSITFAIAYRSNWANLATNDDERVYGHNNAMEMISLCQVMLSWWSESMHSSNWSIGLVGAHCQPLPTIQWKREKQHKTLARLKSTMMLPLVLLAPHSSPSAYVNGSDKHSKIHCERIASMSTHKKEWKMKKQEC